MSLQYFLLLPTDFFYPKAVLKWMSHSGYPISPSSIVEERHLPQKCLSHYDRISCHDPSDTLGGLHNCEVTISLPGDREYMSSSSPTCCRMQNLCNFGILAPLYCTCEIAVTYSKSNEPHNFSLSGKVICRLDLSNQWS